MKEIFSGSRGDSVIQFGILVFLITERMKFYRTIFRPKLHETFAANVKNTNSPNPKYYVMVCVRNVKKKEIELGSQVIIVPGWASTSNFYCLTSIRRRLEKKGMQISCLDSMYSSETEKCSHPL